MHLVAFSVPDSAEETEGLIKEGLTVSHLGKWSLLKADSKSTTGTV